MNDPSFSPQRSITFYVAAERTANERTMTVWAVVALAVVVFMITIGGCA